MKKTIVLLCGVFIAGCNAKAPVTPAKFSTAKVQVHLQGDLSLSAQAPSAPGGTAAGLPVLYRVVTELSNGSVFFTPLETAFVNPLDPAFALDLPVGHRYVVSVQFESGSEEYLGAEYVDLREGGASLQQAVFMGNLNRDCYFVAPVGVQSSGASYDFANDMQSYPVTCGGTWDISFNNRGGGSFVLEEAQTCPSGNPQQARIAYLGNGPLAAFPMVPPDTAFHPASLQAKGGPIAAGDIFCVKLASLPGHAWIQIVDPGDPVLMIEPKFRYRVNRFLPFYAYDRTPADQNGLCSTSW